MKIIVTGSLGNISKPLATELVQKGHSVTVISSNADRTSEINALGASAAIGSVEDADFLATTFQDADAVYAMIPPDLSVPDPIERYTSIGKSYADAIRRSGVARVALLSSWGAHRDNGTGVIVGSYHVERIFDELENVAIAILRPTSFYNNLYHYVSMIKSMGFIGTNYGGEDKLVMVSPKDIAAVAADELTSQIPSSKIRYIASDERSCGEIAGILGNAIGKPELQWITFSDIDTKTAMERNGVTDSLAEMLVELNASIRSGLIREDYDLYKPANMGKVKVEDFAKEFAFAFK